MPCRWWHPSTSPGSRFSSLSSASDTRRVSNTLSSARHAAGDVLRNELLPAMTALNSSWWPTSPATRQVVALPKEKHRIFFMFKVTVASILVYGDSCQIWCCPSHSSKRTDLDGPVFVFLADDQTMSVVLSRRIKAMALTRVDHRWHSSIDLSSQSQLHYLSCRLRSLRLWSHQIMTLMRVKEDPKAKAKGDGMRDTLVFQK